MIESMGGWTLKALTIWIAVIVGTIVGLKVGGVAGEPPPLDGPLSPGSAFLVVTALYAATLAAMGAQARIRGLPLALFLFVVMFGAQAVLMQIETVFFGAHVKVPAQLVPRIVAAAAVAAAFGAAVTAMLFRPLAVVAPKFDGLAWRIPVTAAVYVCLYFVAGYFVAWQSPELRTFYGEGIGINIGPMAAMQFMRGIGWTLLAYLMVRNLTGALATRKTMVAAAFAVFGAAQLLYPNPYIPWVVRLPHLAEIALSNALFGAIAVVILRPRSWNPQRGLNPA